jgi:tetratricopeptide (TPR) repeat protein
MAAKPSIQVRKTNYPGRVTGLPKAPAAALILAVLVVVGIVVHHPQPARATRGPVQRLYLPVTVDTVGLIEKLKAGKFDVVESTLKSYEDTAAKEPRAEMNLAYAFGAFASSDPEVADKVREWAAKSPDSANAHCARAIVLEEAAAEARGHEGGPTSNIPPDHFMDMEKDLNQSVMEADSARGLNPNLINAYLPAIDAARMEMDPIPMDDANKRALDKFPASFQIRRDIVTSMEPRWGGSYDAMDKFANESQAYISMNPMLHYLLGFPAMAQAHDLQLNEKWAQAITLLNQAIELGGDYPSFYLYRGNSYYGLQKYDQALADYQCANELTPDNPENLQMLALTAHSLNRATDALGYANRYLKLKDSNKEIADVHEWAISQVLKN